MKKRLIVLAGCLAIMLLAAGCGTKKMPWSDYLELGDYKGIEVTKASTEVTEEEFNQKLDSLLQENGSYEQIKEGTVKEGDTVNIAFVGKKDGEAFDGGSADSYDLTIGAGQFIPGFEEGLVGVKVGDTVDLDLTFPDNYKQADLAGQAVVFTVTVHYIQGEKILPEWTDEFVQGISEFKTVDEYKADVKKNLEESKKTSVTNEQKYELLEKLVANCEVKSYPEDKLQDYKDRMKKSFTQQATYYGMEYKDLIQAMFGMDEEAFETELDTAAKSVVAQSMALETIAAKEGLDFSKSELEKASLEYVKGYNFENVEAYEEAYGEGSVKADLLHQKVLDYLMENAVEVEATASPEPTAEPTTEPAQ